MGEAIEVRSAFTPPDFGVSNVAKYLDLRKRKPALKEKVRSRFNKILDQISEAGGTRIKGMSVAAATIKGNEFIEAADYNFLKELCNVPRGRFLTVLFDDPYQPVNKNNK